MVCAQTGKTRRHVEQIMSETTTPQQGADTKPVGEQPAQQQQGQTPPAPPQHQAGVVIRDWASI